MSLTPHLWEDVTANTYNSIQEQFDGQTYGDVEVLGGDYFQYLGATALEDPIIVFQGDVRSFVVEEELITFHEDQQAFISEFTVVFNEDINSPGFDITVRGLQESTVEFQRVDVFRRDPSGRYPDRRVRGLADVLVQDNDMFITDYEAPLNVPLEYYLRLFQNGAVFTIGPVLPTPQPFIPTLHQSYGGGTAYLKVINNSTLNLPLMIERWDEWSFDGRIYANEVVLGRRNPVIIGDVLSGRQGAFSGHAILERGQNSERIEEALAPGAVLLLQNHNRTVSALRDMFFVATSATFTRGTKMVWNGELDNPPQPRAIVTFSIDYIEVDRPNPTGEEIPQFRWQIVFDTHCDWEHVLDRYEGWGGVLANPFGPGCGDS